MIDSEKTDWLEGRVLLTNTQIYISLPPKVRIRYVGDTPESRFFQEKDAEGQVRYNKNTELTRLEFTIDYKTFPQNPAQAVFIPGHEEGHICELTGNLRTLYRAAKNLGLEFDVLTETAATESDRQTLAFLDAYPSELDQLYVREFGEREDTADIAGLITLIRNKADPQLIRKITNAIKQPSFFRKVPKILEQL